MSENISRSSIFRNKMKNEALKRKEEQSSINIKPHKREGFYSDRSTQATQNNSER